MNLTTHLRSSGKDKNVWSYTSTPHNLLNGALTLTPTTTLFSPFQILYTERRQSSFYDGPLIKFPYFLTNHKYSKSKNGQSAHFSVFCMEKNQNINLRNESPPFREKNVSFQLQIYISNKYFHTNIISVIMTSKAV
jgi:glucan biosynthesis protein